MVNEREERRKRIDPDGICAHTDVERELIESNDLYSDTWSCKNCGALFYQLPKFEFSGEISVMEPCLTLRDQFAMAAMQGLISNGTREPDLTIALVCYDMADVMLKVRKNGI